MNSRLEPSPAETALAPPLSKSEGRYRDIFHAAGVSIWEEDFSAVKAALDTLIASGVTDLPHYLAAHPQFVREAIGLVKILDVNDASLRMFGAQDKAELMGSLHRIFLPETEVAFARELVAIAEGRAMLEAEATVRTLQGERREVLFTIAFPPAGSTFDRVLIVLMDITARKRAEEALREDAHTLETLNRVGIMLSAELDLQRIVQTVTDAATQLSGAQFGAFFYNVTNETGDAYLLYALSGAARAAFDKLGMPRNTAVFAHTFSGRGPVRLDDVTQDPRYGHNPPHYGMPKGHLPVRSYLAVPVLSRSSEVIGGLFFGHSRPGVFTERAEWLVTGIASHAAVAIDNARLYEQRQQLIDELRQADRRKDEFLATLSHELRNPLAPLCNSLHLLRLIGNGNSSLAPVHEMMERQVNHLVRLVDDLLEMSRISRGTFELRKERIEVAAIVHNAVETSGPLIDSAGHTLKLVLPEEPLWLDGDPVRLAQILANLLNNAAKYTPAGGHIELTAQREDGALAISVRDNGLGITAEALPEIFEMFSRGDHLGAGDRGGLGIGLALARRLVEMHGGAIEARSAGAGRGSEFIVRLPLAQAAAQPTAAAPAIAAPIRRRRILVVDDNRDAGDSLSLILQCLGADVWVARDGPTALQMFATYEPAVVLLDIGMPGMDGYEVARRIRHEFSGRRVMLVALTGWGQEEDRRRARVAGFDHHLVKPAEIGALQALLSSLEPRTTAPATS